MQLKWFMARCWLLWKFVGLIPEARKLELEWQKAQQKRDDKAFAGVKEEYLYMQGYCDAILYVINRFKDGRPL